jgi:hypothetical protein
LNFTTTETFDSAVVTIGNTSDYSSDLSAATAGATLTLGSGLTIDDAGDNGGLGGPGAIVNQGKIDAATNGGDFSIGSLSGRTVTFICTPRTAEPWPTPGR